MKNQHLYIIAILGFLVSGCLLNNSDYDFEYDIIVTDTPANLQGLNTYRDDYNSDLPYPGYRTDIIFSSNRNAYDGNFDIVSGILDVSYHEKDDILNVRIPNNDISRIFPQSFYQSINTENNELGPYSYLKDKDHLFLYASEENEQYKIKLINITRGNYGDQQIFDPVTLAKINDLGDNLYPTRSSQSNELLFCSNRADSVFNIWLASYNAEITAHTLTTGDLEKIEKIETLSSNFDDKCPFYKDNSLVFSSNRPGGYGGFDLWYSRFVNSSWTTPINLGEKINSEYDEYRPVRFDFINDDVMIFSSNRPEGVGGFDLYILKFSIEQ